LTLIKDTAKILLIIPTLNLKKDHAVRLLRNE